jgi:hypothetical protein
VGADMITIPTIGSNGSSIYIFKNMVFAATMCVGTELGVTEWDI